MLLPLFSFDFAFVFLSDFTFGVFGPDRLAIVALHQDVQRSIEEFSDRTTGSLNCPDKYVDRPDPLTQYSLIQPGIAKRKFRLATVLLLSSVNCSRELPAI